MTTTTFTNSICITGIAVKTSNENSEAAVSIPRLWQRFMAENIIAQLPGKLSDDIYCVYTDYEKDYTKPYTVILGCQVKQDALVPDGFTSKTIAAGIYARFTATGSLDDGIIFREWLSIWNLPLDRIYTTDFEVYGSGAADPGNATVDIFVGIKPKCA